MNSLRRIHVILEEGENHLPVPLVGCPRPVEGPIPVALPNTSMIINQHICIR